jgi:sugar phosphate permease
MAGGIFFNLIFANMASLTAFVIVWCACRFFLSMGWGGIVKTIGAWYEQKRHGTIMGLISINFQFGGVAATLFSGLLVAYGLSWVLSLENIGLISEGTARWLSSGAASPVGCSGGVTSTVTAGFAGLSKDISSGAGVIAAVNCAITPGAGWHLLFVCPALLVCLVFIWSFFASKDHPHKLIKDIDFPEQDWEEDAEPEQDSMGLRASIRGMFQSPLFLSLLLFSFLTTILRSVFMFWIPKFLTDIGMGTSNAIIKSALFPFLGALGTIVLGWYTDNYSTNGNRAKIMWIMLVALAACLFGIGVLSQSGLAHEGLIVTLIGLCGFFLLGPYSMASGCLTLDIVGHKRAGACTGLLDGTGYVGAALATFLVGKASDKLGWPMVFTVTAVVGLLSAGSAFLMSALFQREALLEGKAG